MNLTSIVTTKYFKVKKINTNFEISNTLIKNGNTEAQLFFIENVKKKLSIEKISII